MSRLPLLYKCVCLFVILAAAGCAARRPQLDAVMKAYCDAPDSNQHWCLSNGNPRTDLPLVQQWEIAAGYCEDPALPPSRSTGYVSAVAPLLNTNPASDTVCKELASATMPFALEFDMRLKQWSGNDAFDRRPRQGALDIDQTGKPSLYLSKGEPLGVVVSRVNPAAYRAEQGETKVGDIEGLSSIQVVLTAAGGALGSLASVVGLSAAQRERLGSDALAAQAAEPTKPAQAAVASARNVAPAAAVAVPLDRASNALKDMKFAEAAEALVTAESGTAAQSNARKQIDAAQIATKQAEQDVRELFARADAVSNTVIAETAEPRVAEGVEFAADAKRAASPSVGKLLDQGAASLKALRFAAAAEAFATAEQQPGVSAATRARIEGAQAATKAAEGQVLQLFSHVNVADDALKEDLKIVDVAVAAINGPLNEVKQTTDNLDMQLRRVQVVGRGLNDGPQAIGNEFDSSIEQAATWTRLFENLRAEQRAANAQIGSCKALLEKYLGVVAADADKPPSVETAALNFQRELARDGTNVRSTCALPKLQSELASDVRVIQRLAAELSQRPSSEWVANARPLRAAQARGREVFATPAGILLRQTATFSAALADVEKILAKEADIKKQAGVSKMLTDRFRDASLRAFGGAVDDYQCGARLTTPAAMSLRVVKPPAVNENVVVSIELFSVVGPPPTKRITIPTSAKQNDTIPIGLVDVDYYYGCAGMQVDVNGATAPSPSEHVTPVVHRGYFVSDRLFVHERIFEGALTKVQTDKIIVSLSQPKDIELVVGGPEKVESTYDVSRRQGALFGANVGVVYTPAFSRTFTLVDPTPLETVATTVTTDADGTKQVTTVLEAKRVEEQSRETRAGQLAALLNLRLLQAIAPQTATHWLKPGVEVGFGIDTSKPSLLLGGSLEIFKYFRVGGGAAWVSTTDAVDPNIIGTDVPPDFVVPTETKFRRNWYASFTFALDSLSLFSAK